MISVVIPTLREEKRLPACLAALAPQAREVGAEILVVDGGSEDLTEAAARSVPGVLFLTAPRGRGSQMNHGARWASGSLLLFLPADTVLPGGALRTLARIDQAGRPRAGGFRMSFDRPRTALRAVAALHNLRARLTGIVYGDQALFVRRDVFLGLGGFREDLPIEDVELGLRLRRVARPVLLRDRVTTSARRFDRAGDLRATAAAAWILLRFTLFRSVTPSRTFFDPVR